MSLLIEEYDLYSRFPTSFKVDANFKVADISPALKKYMPSLNKGDSIFDILNFHRPVTVYDAQSFKDNINSLFLLISKDNTFAIRGEFLASVERNEIVYLFLGNPWLNWMTNKRQDIRIAMSDFGNQDSQLDHDMYVTTQASMMDDLKVASEKAIKAKEEIELAIKVQSDFFAVMSHEMRTPLNGITNALDLIESSNDQDKKDKLFSIAQTSARNLLSVINYVLDYSKLQSGKLKEETELFNLKTMVSTVMDISKPKAKNKALYLRHSIANLPEYYLQGDENKIKQILINLVNNALKFTHKGGVSLDANILVLDDKTAELQITVSDTGDGIKKEHQPFIFDAFWTSKDKTDGGEANTGLGLNIVTRLITLLNGKIDFTSSAGEGTVFRITLPITISEEKICEIAKQQNDRYETLKLTKFKSSYRVLLVDDNETNLIIGKMMLEDCGVFVDSINNGYNAISMHHQQPYDLILMDITMPGISGQEATQEIRTTDIKTPILALTAHVGIGFDKDFLAAGMQDVLHKPIDKIALVKSLKNWLPNSASLSPSPCQDAYNRNSEQSAIVINEEALDLLINDIGIENFYIVRDAFLHELTIRLQNLQKAWNNRDLDLAQTEAHTLSSSSKSFGAMYFGDLTRTIELSINDSNLHSVEKMINEACSLREKIEYELIQIKPNTFG
ncbi:ATP-binding protein [Pseudoalteromonas sp.]|uniref:ATP-binding protein n=1 Tax=Pseudoalteromonas sp. TaxID=53249 RepID=UPI003563104A